MTLWPWILSGVGVAFVIAVIFYNLGYDARKRDDSHHVKQLAKYGKHRDEVWVVLVWDGYGLEDYDVLAFTNQQDALSFYASEVDSEIGLYRRVAKAMVLNSEETKLLVSAQKRI